ncbi:type II toxin-antitoxin system VapC family toxin [Vulcanococcus limneticus Candia 3F8]|uniref:type II toxin-antitoxin system VapC family toxin n=1 Tax=Vulcanococcus limneticus TaxID=2170428 RepID=UPI000B98CAF1|nr:type II toxin-antitoxin system VapC family toxin [Vulcanococcus limneticus]MCP9792737.1 type II toxin-antitoxin system VapC family toxin [Vulcanococcus limneticus MW73D5]MCP9895215.1 type II toxin-antitoxin system VapC family toxin [Vulcanococcus limneticus Candia 3F8]MCP9898174.1 type II toxin-antitoxin system VapC family toxin [Vulcanococcus limneticus Candia 3B3]
MKITADTNLLVRAVVQDDPGQALAASELLQKAELVAVPLPVLCEFVWVLRRVYAFTSEDCIAAIEALMASEQVVVDGPAVGVGLTMLATGGDFADGVIAHGGHWLGGEVLATFDRKAADLLKAQGIRTLLL